MWESFGDRQKINLDRFQKYLSLFADSYPIHLNILKKYQYPLARLYKIYSFQDFSNIVQEHSIFTFSGKFLSYGYHLITRASQWVPARADHSVFVKVCAGAFVSQRSQCIEISVSSTGCDLYFEMSTSHR
jgi:hypothetical protein